MTPPHLQLQLLVGLDARVLSLLRLLQRGLGVGLGGAGGVRGPLADLIARAQVLQEWVRSAWNRA